LWLCCPADDDNDAVLFEKIKSGNYDADDPIWENISDEAKDVVAKLLTVRPGQCADCLGRFQPSTQPQTLCPPPDGAPERDVLVQRPEHRHVYVAMPLNCMLGAAGAGSMCAPFVVRVVHLCVG
jgi:hypothetical protein